MTDTMDFSHLLLVVALVCCLSGTAEGKNDCFQSKCIHHIPLADCVSNPNNRWHCRDDQICHAHITRDMIHMECEDLHDEYQHCHHLSHRNTAECDHYVPYSHTDCHYCCQHRGCLEKIMQPLSSSSSPSSSLPSWSLPYSSSSTISPPLASPSLSSSSVETTTAQIPASPTVTTIAAPTTTPVTTATTSTATTPTSATTAATTTTATITTSAGPQRPGRNSCFTSFCYDHHHFDHVSDCVAGQWACRSDQFCRLDLENNGEIAMRCLDSADHLETCLHDELHQNTMMCYLPMYLPADHHCQYCCNDSACIHHVTGTTPTTTAAPLASITTRKPGQCVRCGDYQHNVPCTDLDLIMDTVTACDHPDHSLCMTDVIVDSNGKVATYKRCVDAQTCTGKWYLQTSDKHICLTFDPSSATPDLMCHYCCVGDGCNTNTVPDQNKLWRP